MRSNSDPLSISHVRETSSMPLRRVFGRLLSLSALLSVVALGWVISSAQAAGPQLSVAISHSPAVFQRGDSGDGYLMTVTNIGNTPTNGAINLTAALAAGVEPRGALSTPDFQGSDGVCTDAGTTCTTNVAIAPGDSSTVSLVVTTRAEAADSVISSVTVSGGGAPDAATSTDTAVVVDRPVFDATDFTARALDALGDDYVVAGGHPDRVINSFAIPSYASGSVLFSLGAPGLTGRSPVEDLKDVFVDLPPGFVGNAAAAPRCTTEQLTAFFPLCPPGSKVGTLKLSTYDVDGPPVPFFNMVPEKGFPAAFGFRAGINTGVLLFVKLRPRTGQYGVTVATPGAVRLGITGVSVSVDGFPSVNNGSGGPQIPFLTNPTDCLAAQPTTSIVVDSWQHPGPTLVDGSPDLSDPRWKSHTAPAPAVTGCDASALASQFAPRFDMRPTPGSGSLQADAPSGYRVDLSFPQTNDSTDPSTVFDPTLPAAPPLKNTVVTLPAGVAVSPSAADGLDGCSDLPGLGDRVHYDRTTVVSCPDGSKIGTVTATSPLLASRDPDTDAVTGAEPVGGDIYIVKPHPGDLSPDGEGDGTFRFVIQAESEQDGINVKLPGEVTADRITGRLTARVQDSPQFPLKDVSLLFKGGDRAALVNPPTCATGARTTGVFTPWSRGGTRSDGVVVAGTPDATASSVFDISWDGQGASCPATLPFSPQVKAGLADSQAGGSSPFTFDLTREDRTDVINGVNVALPGGLLAAVKDVALCSDADADAGSCPADSRVGSASVAAGSGAKPFYLTGQPVSLTGPYKGAPYGLAIAVHAVAGPFDLGTVVVRQALQVNPDDVHATVVSDPLPTIRDGIPLRVRRIHVTVDRPGFMRSLTSCEQKTITSTISSLGGQTASLTTPLDATGCAKLPFAPKLAMRLTGKSQAKVGGHPGVEALVTQRPGEAGVKALTVTLPLSLALDPDNAASDNLCEYTDGLKDQCPDKSVIGTMTAVSPLLKRPLGGKVYFVKGVRTDPKSGRQIKTLPTLLVELRGEVNVNLRASNSVPDNQHLTTTFPNIPDAPLSSAFLKLNGGKHGILVVTDGHDDLCYTPQKPFLAATAQSGKRVDTATTLTPECPLAVVSRTFTSSSVKVRVSGIGAGSVTISGSGLRTTRRTISSATSATLTAKLTAKGKRMRRAKQDVRVKVSFVAKGTKKAQVAYSPKPKAAAKKS
jgi:hypothetical protein